MDGVSLDVGDVKYIPVYQDYVRLSQEGHKKTYIMQYLSDEYNIAERTIYRIIDKFSTTVNIWGFIVNYFFNSVFNPN